MTMAHQTTAPKTGFGETKGEDLTTKARDAASSAYDKAKEGAANVADKAKDMAGNVADRAKDAASNLGRQAEDATHNVGRGMENLAGTIRESMPREGIMGAATSRVAGGLEATGQYLEHEGLSGMGRDMTNLIRNNPIPALLVGIGLGFLLARVTSSRS